MTQLDPLPQDPPSGRPRRTVASVHPRRAKTGSRVTSWRLHFRVHGKPQALTFATEDHARRWADTFNAVGVADGLALLKAHVRAETPTSDPEEPEPEAAESPTGVRTVRDAVEACINDLTGVEPGYVDRCRAAARRHIYPVLVTVDDTDRGGASYRIPLGDVPLERFDRQIAKSWIKELTLTKRAGRGSQADGTLSPKTIKHRHGLLSQAMTYASRERGWIPANPCVGVQLPKVIRSSHVYLSPERQRLLVEAVDPRYRDLLVILLATGMRWSEATALHVEDVDLAPDAAYLINIRRAWKDVRQGSQRLGAPKTVRGVRDLPVPPGSPAHDALQRALDGRPHGSLLFPSPEGKQLRNSEFHSRVWQPMKKRLTPTWPGRFPTVHDLRHTFASTLIGSGVDVLTVSHLLGHEKVSTTLDTYGHLVPGRKQAGMQIMANVMAGVLGQSVTTTSPQPRNASLPAAELASPRVSGPDLPKCERDQDLGDRVEESDTDEAAA